MHIHCKNKQLLSLHEGHSEYKDTEGKEMTAGGRRDEDPYYSTSGFSYCQIILKQKRHTLYLKPVDVATAEESSLHRLLPTIDFTKLQILQGFPQILFSLIPRFRMGLHAIVF